MKTLLVKIPNPMAGIIPRKASAQPVIEPTMTPKVINVGVDAFLIATSIAAKANGTEKAARITSAASPSKAGTIDLYTANSSSQKLPPPSVSKTRQAKPINIIP